MSISVVAGGHRPSKSELMARGVSRGLTRALIYGADHPAVMETLVTHGKMIEECDEDNGSQAEG